MKKKLIIHIGAGKTGSSAIQRSLALNSEVLLTKGVLIPGSKLDIESECIGEQIWFFQNGISNPEFPNIVKRRIKRLHGYMCENDLHTLIVSAENLINPENFQNLFTDLQNEFDVSVICYVRRQDEYMISAWQQWYLKNHDSFDSYRLEMGQRVDWYLALEPWKNAFGQGNIIVRVYEKDRLKNGNIIEDFFQILELDTAGLQPVVEKINKSVDEKFNYISNKYRDELFKNIHDNDFYQFLFYSFGEKAFKSYRGSSVLTLAQRKNILATYNESNSKLLEEYLSDSSNRTLFVKPDESDVYKPESNQLSGDMEYLLVGMFGMYKRMMSESA